MTWQWPQFVVALLLFFRVTFDVAKGMGDEDLRGLGKLIFYALTFGFAALWIVALYAGGFW